MQDGLAPVLHLCLGTKMKSRETDERRAFDPDVKRDVEFSIEDKRRVNELAEKIRAVVIDAGRTKVTRV